MWNLLYPYHLQGKTQVGWAVVVIRKLQRWTIVNNAPSKWSFYYVPNFDHSKQCSLQWSLCYVTDSDKMTMRSHVRRLEKNRMGIGVHIIVEQMRTIDSKNWTKTIILKKWLIVTSHWRHYKYLPITPHNLSANLTLFEHHKSLSHTRCESLH